MSAIVIILPVVRIERYDPDTGILAVVDGPWPFPAEQRLLPSSDRRNIVVLERERAERRR